MHDGAMRAGVTKDDVISTHAQINTGAQLRVYTPSYLFGVPQEYLKEVYGFALIVIFFKLSSYIVLIIMSCK